MDPLPRPVVLTEHQTRVLWLLSVGRTREDIGRDTDDTPGGVKSACRRIYLLLGAATAAQAVRNGLLGGHIGPYEDCGGLAAYRRHIKREEATCAACKRGNRERVEAGAHQRHSGVRLGEPETRLLRAFEAGRTVDQVSAAWNVSRNTVKKLTASAYAALGVDRLPPSVRREAALREARRQGLFETRMPTRPAAAVKAVTLTKTQVSILAELAAGASINGAADRLGMSRGTCASRLSEAYQRLDVAWMDKAVRRDTAIRKARRLGLLPDLAAV
jgi:DNA-binding NarL/FixJ family response regulator